MIGLRVSSIAKVSVSGKYRIFIMVLRLAVVVYRSFKIILSKGFPTREYRFFVDGELIGSEYRLLRDPGLIDEW